MRFFQQTEEGSCQIVALRHALSFFGMHPDPSDIRAALPGHDFGNLLPELGSYLAARGIRTTLVSNGAVPSERDFLAALHEYLRVGTFEMRTPTPLDLSAGPAIVNVDWYKIAKESGGPGAHYVFFAREEGALRLYDGDVFDGPVEAPFAEILRASADINEFHENGMWLFLHEDSTTDA